MVTCTLWFSKCLKWHGLFNERFIPFLLLKRWRGQNSVWSYQEWKQLHHNILENILRHLCIIEISHHWFGFFTYLTISHYLNKCGLTVNWVLSNIPRFEGLIQQGKSEGFDSCDRPSNLKLDSNRQFFRPCDREIWWMTSKNNRTPLLCYFKLCASFRSHWWIQSGVTVQKRPRLLRGDQLKGNRCTTQGQENEAIVVRQGARLNVRLQWLYHCTDITWALRPLNNLQLDCLFNSLFSKTVEISSCWPFVKRICQWLKASHHKEPVI